MGGGGSKAGGGADRASGGGPGFLIEERPRIDALLAEISAETSRSLTPVLREPVRYALGTAGKRIRPALCLAAWRAAASDSEMGTMAPEGVYRLACAVEMVHTYSLIHDDLPCMDNDDLRRGRPTVHRVFGTDRAILAGAALLPLAADVSARAAEGLGLGTMVCGRMLSELMHAAGADGMVGGQLLDLSAEGREISGEELETIHRLKTGALLVASLRIGAIAGGADDLLLTALTRYGNALGLAFQIADDLLDVEGSAADLGKTAGRDQLLRKASYPALYGVEGARGMARDRVAEAIDAVRAYKLKDLAELAEYVVSRRR